VAPAGASKTTLARLLLQGPDIVVSLVMNIRVVTARAHLRAILAKTGTHRQPDLVRLLTQEVCHI
jgi:DNA-binding CsgD family transcriptional regulator